MEATDRPPLAASAAATPGSASRWQNHRLPRSTAFVAELPRQVSDALVNRGVTAVYKLASELASPGIGPGEQPAG